MIVGFLPNSRDPAERPPLSALILVMHTPGHF